LFWRYEETPLQAAITWRSAQIVKCLLDQGANPDAGNPRHFAPLSSACVQGDLAIIELLVSHGAYIDGEPGAPTPSPIGVATSRRNLELIERLLAHGADPSTAFAKNVAIHQASCVVLARLLDAGASAPADVERAVRTGKW